MSAAASKVGGPHEPSAWLRASIDARLAAFDSSFRAARRHPAGAPQIIQIMLGDPPAGSEPEDEAWVRWETTCDRCGTYQPPPMMMLNVMTQRYGMAVNITLALCDDCTAKERI